MKLRRAIILLGLITMAVLGGGVWTHATQSAVTLPTTQDQAPKPLPEYAMHILYLAPADLPAIEQLDKAALPGQVIEVLRSAADFQKRSDASVRALIVHKGKLAEINPVWLREQFKANKAIVGIDIEMPELENLIGSLPQTSVPPEANGALPEAPSWVAYDGKTPIYSAMFHASGEKPDRWSVSSRSSDYLRSPTAPLGFIIENIVSFDHPETIFKFNKN